MKRLTQTTAAAALLLLLASTPASAMATGESVSTPADPTVIRTLSAPTEPPLVLVTSHAGTAVLAVPATRTEPVTILMADNPVSYDQKPLVVDGTLMVPLRSIVEAAGGEVGWDGETRTVTVRLGDRSAHFVIGASEAEMNQDGVNYLRRNMIRMNKAPLLAGGRTLVAADSLTSILGMMEKPGLPGMLNLLPASPAEQPAPQAEEQDWIIVGTVKEVKSSQNGLSILVGTGPVVSHGEGSLVWFAVTDSTQITVEEQGVQRQGSMADLAASQHVEVRPVGPLLMSFPAQGGAASILIRK